MPGVLSFIEQWIEEHTPDPSQEGNYPPHRFALSSLARGSEAEVKKSSPRRQWFARLAGENPCGMFRFWGSIGMT